jgi:hypothetical protein
MHYVLSNTLLEQGASSGAFNATSDKLAAFQVQAIYSAADTAVMAVIQTVSAAAARQAHSNTNSVLAHALTVLTAVLTGFQSSHASRDLCVKLCSAAADLWNDLSLSLHCVEGIDSVPPATECAGSGVEAGATVALHRQLCCRVLAQAFYTLRQVAEQDSSPRKMWDAAAQQLLLKALPAGFAPGQKGSEHATAVQHALCTVFMHPDHLQVIADENALSRVADDSKRPEGHESLAQDGAKQYGPSYAAQLLMPWRALERPSAAASHDASAGKSRKRKRAADSASSQSTLGYSDALLSSLPAYAAWLLKSFAEAWRHCQEQKAKKQQESSGGSTPVQQMNASAHAPVGMLQSILTANLRMMQRSCAALAAGKALGQEVSEQNGGAEAPKNSLHAMSVDKAQHTWCVAAEACAALMHVASAGKVGCIHCIESSLSRA